MSDPIGWQCRDCDEIGDNPGTAVAHLQDTSIDVAHTVDFIDADGAVHASATRDGDGNVAPLEDSTAVDEPVDESGGDEPVVMSARDAAHLHYIQAVMDDLGADTPIVPCPTCTGQGFRVLELLQAADSEQCVACNGFGRVLLPSSVPGQQETMCTACGGNGWCKTASVTPLPHAPAQQPAGGLPTPPPGYAWTDDGQLVRLTG